MSDLAKIEDIIGKMFIEEGKLNAFVWIDINGLLRICAVRRNMHRPSCYGQGEGQHLISPGCIDMAGVLITPIKNDYETLTENEIREIYKESSVE